MFATKFRLKVLFVLVFLTSDCLGASQPKSIEKQLRNRMIPGLHRMAQGIDITRLDLLAKSLNTDDGFRSVLFEFSCNSDRKWHHENVPNVDYERADQVSSIDSITGGTIGFKRHFLRNITDVKASMMASVDVKIDVNSQFKFRHNQVVGSFSESVHFNAYLNSIFNDNSSICEIFGTIHTVRIDLDKPQFLRTSKMFALYLNELTGTYDEQPEMYDRFVQKFGTHYFSSATFGGIVTQTIHIKNDYIAITGQDELNQNIQTSVFSVSLQKGSVNVADRASYSKFQRKSKSKFAYFGGFSNMLLISAKDVNVQFVTKWAPTLNKLPWLLGGQLVPIEKLVQNTTTKAQLKKAIEIHRIRAYFNELNMTRTLSGFKFTGQHLNKFNIVQNLIAQKQFDSLDKLALDIRDLLAIVLEFSKSFWSERALATLYVYFA